MDAPLKTCKGLWFPISELQNKYHQPLMLSSPKLIDLDSNPQGVSMGYWQDDEGWVVIKWDMNNDEPIKAILKEEEVSHFLYVEGPWSDKAIAVFGTYVEPDTAAKSPLSTAEFMKQQAEEEAKKLASDLGYVYYDGKDGRPDNWDRDYILRRGGMIDGTKATDDAWYWADKAVISYHDIIGIQTNPQQSSSEMTLQGLWSWYRTNGAFSIDFSDIKDDLPLWIVYIGETPQIAQGELKDILIQCRDVSLECEMDLEKMVERLRVSIASGKEKS